MTIKRWRPDTHAFVDEAGGFVAWEDHCAELADLREQVAALQSREVCTAPHENVEECGYCQRDRLALRLDRIRDWATRGRQFNLYAEAVGHIFAELEAPAVEGQELTKRNGPHGTVTSHCPNCDTLMRIEVPQSTEVVVEGQKPELCDECEFVLGTTADCGGCQRYCRTTAVERRRTD